MKKITTRKIVFGMLMTLVLAFGVLGIAEAIDDPNIADSILNPTTVYDVGSKLSETNSLSIPISADNALKIEKVYISKSSGITLLGNFYQLPNVTLTEVDSLLTDQDNGTTFTYTRDNRTQPALSSPVTIDLTFTTKGKQWVKIAYSGEDSKDNDIGDGDKEYWSHQYNYYVKGSGTSTTTISLAGLSNGYKTGIFSGDAHRVTIHNGDSNHYDVTYTTIPADSAEAQIETTAGALGTLEGLNNKKTSSAFDVLLQTNKTVQVTAKVKDSERETVGVYIIGTPKLVATGPAGADARGTKTKPGRINETLPNAFTATVTDGVDVAVPGIVVKFQVNGSGDAEGYLVFDSARRDSPNAGILVTSERRKRFAVGSTTELLKNDTAKTLYVRTDSFGKATVDFQLGTDRKQDVIIDVLGSGVVEDNKTVSAYAGTAGSGNQLVDPESKSSQASGHAGEYELRVKAVGEDGEALSDETIEFRTSDGMLDDPDDAEGPTNLGRIRVKTDTRGVAFIFFDPKDGSSTLRVSAHLFDLNGTPDNLNDDVVIDDEIFNIRGGGTTPSPPVTQTASLTITATGTGTTRSVTVTALNPQGATVPGLFVTLSGTALPGGSQNVRSGTATTITLPSTPDTYTLLAAASGYVSDTETFTITAPGTLSLEEVGARAANGGQQIRITVRNSAGALASGTVAVALSGAASRTVSTTNGTGGAVITLPTTGGPHSVTLSATGYTTATHTFSTAGQQQPTTGQQPTPTPTTGTASSVRIRSEAFPSGTANTQLAQPLSVRVLDANGNGVSNVRVTFEVTSGNGRLSQRGNGKAVRKNTNASGQASAPYTPRSASSTVRATAAGVSQTVTFSITASGAATTTPTPTPTPGTGDTPTTISPVVHVGAAQRPPMLWVDGGKIYALVGSDVQSWAPSVDNAMNITVAGDKVYWTEKTGESGGTINAANLDGTGVTEITKILATPTGIAVDTTARRIYVVNTGGRILSMNLDGSRIQTVLQNLSNPKDLAVSGGNAYWTQDTGAVRFVNLSGTKNVRNISNGADAAVSLVISGNKVYWTEHTGESGGTIKAANLNGTGVTRVASILAAPTGIAVDAARSKIYVTNTGGRILRMNLNGSYIQTVADGLGMPGDMVINNSIKAPAATPTPTPTPTASGSKYDVNGDGVVDAKDKALVFDAVMAGTYVAKYDVNDDKKLDILDYVRVDVASDAGAASAPSLLGTKFTAREVDRLQEQIDLLIATDDRSPAAIKTLIYLQQLIVMARPEKTQLLANYPNPFNPETWIPYELATDTEVRITIYNAQGVVIRTLQLGQQSAGYYTDRERAAYWDGRNALGEQVASGIYFYQFETDEMSSMRKMVILK